MDVNFQMRCLRIDHCGSKSIFSDIVQLLDKWIVALTPTNGLEAAPVLEAVEAATSVLELDLTFHLYCQMLTKGIHSCNFIIPALIFGYKPS